MENTHSEYGTKLCAYSRPAKYEGALEALKYRESNAVTPLPVTRDWPLVQNVTGCQIHNH